MRLRGTTMKILSSSGNYRNKLLLISSIIISQQTQGIWKRTYLPLMKLIKNTLCIPLRDSDTPVLLLVIKISAQHRISRLLLLRLLTLAIRLRRNFNWREGGIIGRPGFNIIWGYLTEIYVWRGVSGTSMSVWLGFLGGPTTVNRNSMTPLHCIRTPLFVSLGMFSVWLVHKNDDFLGYKLSSMRPFITTRLYKRHDLS